MVPRVTYVSVEVRIDVVLPAPVTICRKRIDAQPVAVERLRVAYNPDAPEDYPVIEAEGWGHTFLANGNVGKREARVYAIRADDLPDDLVAFIEATAREALNGVHDS